MTLQEKSDTRRLARIRIRRLHLNTGEVWCFAGVHPTRTDCLTIRRESDGEQRSVADDCWLGDSWGSPMTRRR